LRRGLQVLILSVLLGGIGMLASLTQVGFALEEDLGLGSLFRLRGARPAPDDAVIVRFDRDFLAQLRGLPADPAAWPEPIRSCQARLGGLDKLPLAASLDRLPRTLHACLVEELGRRNAASIAYDISFRRDPSRDGETAAFAAAIRKQGRVVLLAKAVRVRLQQVTSAQVDADAVQADVLEAPDPVLAAEAAAVAPFLLPRAAAKVHQFWAFNPAVALPTQLSVRALEVAALPALERLAVLAGDAAPAGASAADRLEHLTGLLRAHADRLDDLLRAAGTVPTAEATKLRALARAYRGPDAYYLNFHGPSGTFASISAADLLIPGPGSRPDPRFADLSERAVFVGYQELAVPESNDSFPTAFSRFGIDLSGVEIAATAYLNLLRGETVYALPEGTRVVLVGLLGFAMALAGCVGQVWRGLGLVFGVALAYTAVAALSFLLWTLWLPVVVPLLLLLPAAIGLGQLVHYLGAARLLSVYTPRSVSQHLLKGHEFSSDRPERREVTVLLTDIVGFTTLAERTPPEGLTEFINQHFTMLSACVEAEQGTLAQFIGDSMMVFWGAPDPQPDHAARACRTALAIARALEEENLRRLAEGQPPIRVRIGINTGEVTAGNVGAPGRSNYGIVGDTVNTTQRIEQLAKTLCPDRPTAAILVSALTQAKAGDTFHFTDAGVHAVRGRQETVRIFRLHDPRRRLVVAHPARDAHPDRPAPPPPRRAVHRG
jgi:adenylate cyclase